ncbi:hypothetical protein pYptb0041 (plasmid) [Yersinia pseudotuberculosis IP 32953]|uniref:Uncharacterized protein n=1 Tax=Yersinia pseudotuberculosis serotype I (strain IP32953) TaxID=273123 RepID=Q663B4_YERPS|nr:hypothetical protein pYptb0041 [Yersinia pseudotuberculosis IP 32953]
MISWISRLIGAEYLLFKAFVTPIPDHDQVFKLY